MFSWFSDFAGDLWLGVKITIALLLLAGFFGFLLAIGIALMRLARNPVLYYGVGTLFASYPAIRGSVLWPYLREGFWYVAFALILSVGAYVGEVLRGGLRAVPKGELEAARAYGMRPFLMLRRIWLPRALRHAPVFNAAPYLAAKSAVHAKTHAGR